MKKLATTHRGMWAGRLERPRAVVSCYHAPSIVPDESKRAICALPLRFIITWLSITFHITF